MDIPILAPDEDSDADRPARDATGAIRAAGGRGVLIAPAGADRAWLTAALRTCPAGPQRHRLLAAIDLLEREAAPR